MTATTLVEVVEWLRGRDRSAVVHLIPHRTDEPVSVPAGLLLDALSPLVPPAVAKCRNCGQGIRPGQSIPGWFHSGSNFARCDGLPRTHPSESTVAAP